MGAREILLVEDNPDHAALVRKILEQGGAIRSIHWAKNGQEALDFLFRKGAHAEKTRPTLIILDINLPKKNGIEVLKALKSDDLLKVIPVVMLTTSNRADEAHRCYSLGANSYVTKPVQFGEFANRLQSLKHYWTETDRGSSDK